MALNLDRLKVGDVLYDVRKDRWYGLTFFPVRIVEIREEFNEFKKETEKVFICSWNNNPPRHYQTRSLQKLRRNQPKPKTKK